MSHATKKSVNYNYCQTRLVLKIICCKFDSKGHEDDDADFNGTDVYFRNMVISQRNKHNKWGTFPVNFSFQKNVLKMSIFS